MQIAVHVGAHTAEDDRLMKSLLRNNADNYQDGIHIPGPRQYRKLMAQIVERLSRSETIDDANEIFIDSFLDRENHKRVVLSSSHLLGKVHKPVAEGVIYPLAAVRMQSLRKLFEGEELQIFMAIRNPATFLPEIFTHSKGKEFNEYLGTDDPLEIRWSDTIKAMKQAVPDVPIIVWTNEEAPVLWEEVLRLMIGLPEGRKVTGAYDLLVHLLNKEGLIALHKYLTTGPAHFGLRKCRDLAQILEPFVVEEQLEQIISLPGWDENLIEDLTYVYEYDLEDIKNIPGVHLLEL